MTSPGLPQAAAPNYQALAPHLGEGPQDLLSLFSNTGEAELEIEIGFGRGASLLERARLMPDALLVGFEVKAKLAVLVANRRKREALANVRVFADDAALALVRCGPNHSVGRVMIYFPDPWWKKRHAKRRVLNTRLLDELGRLLKVGGELFVQTDVEDRALSYHQLIEAHPAFDFGGASGWIEHNPFLAKSNREIRAERHGLPIWRLLAYRRSNDLC